MNTDIENIFKTLQFLDEEKTTALISGTYARFFEICPEGEALWEKDDPVSREKMFNNIILTVMDNLQRPETCENNLMTDIKDHDEYGVDREMYGLFFRSLLDTFSETLGEGFDQNMKQAWKNQLALIEGMAHKHTAR